MCGSYVLSFGGGGWSENTRDIVSCITSFCVCTSVSVKEKTETILTMVMLDTFHLCSRLQCGPQAVLQKLFSGTVFSLAHAL